MNWLNEASMGKAGDVMDCLSTLRQEPFSFTKEDIRNVIFHIKAIDRSISVAASEVAKSFSLTELQAREGILEGRFPVPKLGKPAHFPTILDVAAHFREWAIYVEDEEAPRKKIGDIFGRYGVRVLLVEDPQEFLETIDNKPFIQYWVDLGLGEKGEIEIGEKLLDDLDERRAGNELFGDVVVFTQHAGSGFLVEKSETGLVTQVIDKGTRNSTKLIEDSAASLLKKLQKEFNVNPAKGLFLSL